MLDPLCAVHFRAYKPATHRTRHKDEALLIAFISSSAACLASALCRRSVAISATFELQIRRDLQDFRPALILDTCVRACAPGMAFKL